MTFEIDHGNDLTGPRTPTTSEEGWNVLAFGRLRVLTDEEELTQVSQSPLRPWADADLLYDLRIAIAMVLTAGGVSAYHWTVHQDDRAAASAAPPRLVRHVLLVSPDGQQLADRIA